jgi:hypothetical protein
MLRRPPTLHVATTTYAPLVPSGTRCHYGRCPHQHKPQAPLLSPREKCSSLSYAKAQPHCPARQSPCVALTCAGDAKGDTQYFAEGQRIRVFGSGMLFMGTSGSLIMIEAIQNHLEIWMGCGCWALNV